MLPDGIDMKTVSRIIITHAMQITVELRDTSPLLS
jgi:hypothetical protein